MEKVDDSCEEFGDITELLSMQPSDTISLIVPDSKVSPSDDFTKKLRLLDDLNPLFPIMSEEDARRFDMELRIFVHSVMAEAIKPEQSKQFSELARKERTPEEEVEYRGLLKQRIRLSAEDIISGKCTKDLLEQMSRRTHRLNELNPKAWIRPAMTMSVFQYSNFDGLPLGDIYEKCRGDYGVFSIFLDLKINFANLAAYVYELLGAEYGVSNAPKMLYPRMELQFYANACVMTCRAIWDKLMGAIVLVELGSEAYRCFIGSTSKKKFFRKRIEQLKSDEFPKEVLEEFHEVITKLDNTFRTQEAHGSGGNIRNAAFSDGSLSNTVLLEIIGHYNYLHEYLDDFWHDVSFLDGKENFINSVSNL